MRGTVTNHPFPLRAFLALIRWPNVLMLICIQALVFFSASGEHITFLLLVVGMTVCLIIAGYIHNDLIDQETDIRNGRWNVFAAGRLSPEWGSMCMRLTGFAGLILASVLAFVYSWLYLPICIVSAVLLRLYTPVLKGIPLAGNLVIGILCAMAVLLVYFPVSPLTDIPAHVAFLSAFAFQATFIREIVKDMEDLAGDLQSGYRTLPGSLGITWTKWIVTAMTSLTVVGLALCLVYLSNHWFGRTWIGLTCLLMIVAGMGLVPRAETRPQFHRISTVLKISMLTGTVGFVFS